MKKKITKIIEASLPQRLFDDDGEPANRRKIADKVYDAIPYIERLDLQPFQTWIPMACSSCPFSDPYKLGCTYNLVSEKVINENPPPDDCPLGYS